MSTGRLEAFSDGVLAIAITLLVLDLRVPPLGHRPLGAALVSDWPEYLAYVVSFAVIGIMWVNHHALFRRVAKVDRPLLFLNLLLLMFIAAIPFPTALAAEGLQRGGRDANIALFTYSVASLLVAVAFSGVWVYIVRTPGILHAPLTGPARGAAVRRFGLGLVVYLLLCVLAFASPIVTLVGHGLMAVYYAFEQLPQTNVATAGA